MGRPLPKSLILQSLPPPWPNPLHARIRQAILDRGEKVVVIDDSPIGTPMLYDVPIVTDWEIETLRKEFSNSDPCFCLPTNSRSLAADQARILVRNLACNLRTAAGARKFTIISRSDSLLCGHFPLETDVLSEVLGPFDATMLIPFCEHDGCLTIDDKHYVAEGDTLQPVSKTPFALDLALGYRNSHLPRFIEEKSRGRIKAREVVSIGIEELRTRGPDALVPRLLALPRGCTVIVNAASPIDLEVLVVALLASERNGRQFCYRTAAQFPAAYIGLEMRALLTAEDLGLGRTAAEPSHRPVSPAPMAVALPGHPHRKVTELEGSESDRKSTPAASGSGGLVLVGSCAAASTRHLARIKEVANLKMIELRVDQLLSARRHDYLAQIAGALDENLQKLRDTVLFTSRRFIRAETPAQSEQIKARISSAITELVRGLEIRPRYIVATGSGTAAEIATRALGVDRAVILGQVAPGVPVWRLGLESDFPGMIFVALPANAGAEALANVLRALNTKTKT